MEKIQQNAAMNSETCLFIVSYHEKKVYFK